MPPSYSHRSVIVLSLLGILSAFASVLSVILIFQLHSQQKTVKESPRDTSIVPAHVWDVLLPVSTVLSALSLTLNLSSVVVCLLHSYFSTEICSGEQDTERYPLLYSTGRLSEHGLCLAVQLTLCEECIEPPVPDVVFHDRFMTV